MIQEAVAVELLPEILDPVELPGVLAVLGAAGRRGAAPRPGLAEVLAALGLTGELAEVLAALGP